MKEEIFKRIFKECSHFEVSNLGRIKSLSRTVMIRNEHIGLIKTKILKHGKDKFGYCRIPLLYNGKRKTYKVHRLVAEAFIPNPENKPQVNHINGIKTDNRSENLEWMTAKENIIHAFEKGLKKGIRRNNNGNSKLSEKDVEDIMCLKGMTHKEISKIYNVSRNCISYIIKTEKLKL